MWGCGDAGSCLTEMTKSGKSLVFSRNGQIRRLFLLLLVERTEVLPRMIVVGQGRLWGGLNVSSMLLSLKNGERQAGRLSLGMPRGFIELLNKTS